jgi:hypothetical protein
VVNFTGWQEASPEEKIFRATTNDDGYQIRAKQQLEKGESGLNWTLIILATILGIIAAAVMAAGAAAFVFRKQIITALLTTQPTMTAAEASKVERISRGEPVRVTRRSKRRRRPEQARKYTDNRGSRRRNLLLTWRN